MLDQSRVDLDENFWIAEFFGFIPFSRSLNSFSAEAPVVGCGLAKSGQNPVRRKIPIWSWSGTYRGHSIGRWYWLEVKPFSTFIGGLVFWVGVFILNNLFQNWLWYLKRGVLFWIFWFRILEVIAVWSWIGVWHLSAFYWVNLLDFGAEVPHPSEKIWGEFSSVIPA